MPLKRGAGSVDIVVFPDPTETEIQRNAPRKEHFDAYYEPRKEVHGMQPRLSFDKDGN